MSTETAVETTAEVVDQHVSGDPAPLPYLMDDVSLPGLNPTIGVATLDQLRPEEFAQLVVRKLRTPTDPP